MFVGSQNGLADPKEIPIQEGTAVGMQKSFFLSNADTIKEIWNEGAKQTGSKWNVESRLLDLRMMGLHQGDGSEYSKVIGYNLHWYGRLLNVLHRRWADFRSTLRTATLMEKAKA